MKRPNIVDFLNNVGAYVNSLEVYCNYLENSGVSTDKIVSICDQMFYNSCLHWEKQDDGCEGCTNQFFANDVG